jgi:ribosomal RNA-processing protein 1
MASSEVKLARRLASNDLSVRKAAEKTLKEWLSNRASKGLSEIEMKRLWKGLFSCMYMSDKPLIQEELARDLSHLIHVFPNPTLGIEFCNVFYQTMSSEWHGIDRLRMDKFYMFVRRFTKEMFTYLHAQGWPNHNVTYIMDKLINLADTCKGLIVHISQLFLVELAKVPCQISKDISMMLLSPWIGLMATSKDRYLVEILNESILDRIVKGHKIKKLTLNWKELERLAMDCSKRPETLTRNRKILNRFITE